MEQVVTKEASVFVRFHGLFQWCGLFATAFAGQKNIGKPLFYSPEKKQEKESL